MTQNHAIRILGYFQRQIHTCLERYCILIESYCILIDARSNFARELFILQSFAPLGYPQIEHLLNRTLTKLKEKDQCHGKKTLMKISLKSRKKNVSFKK